MGDLLVLQAGGGLGQSLGQPDAKWGVDTASFPALAVNNDQRLVTGQDLRHL